MKCPFCQKRLKTDYEIGLHMAPGYEPGQPSSTWYWDCLCGEESDTFEEERPCIEDFGRHFRENGMQEHIVAMAMANGEVMECRGR